MRYDILLIKERIKMVRLNHWKLYKENKEKAENVYEKYACCRTKETLADALEMDRRTVGSWERGNTLPSLENLISLCNLLDCNIEYFLGADEVPYINTVAKASHFTGIDPEIIKYATEHPDYLDCLNYFMHPENCSKLFNKVTLSAWKKFWINQILSDIKSPLIDIIEKAFVDFYTYTPFTDISIEKYKDYLLMHLPIDKLNFRPSTENDSLISIKKSFSLLRYKDFIANQKSTNEYDAFIEYIAKLTFEPLSNREFLEIQKQKIADKFIETVSRYLSDI